MVWVRRGLKHHQFHLPAMGKDIFYYPRLLLALSNLALEISRHGAATDSLGNLCQCCRAQVWGCGSPAVGRQSQRRNHNKLAPCCLCHLAEFPLYLPTDPTSSQNPHPTGCLKGFVILIIIT